MKHVLPIILIISLGILFSCKNSGIIITKFNSTTSQGSTDSSLAKYITIPQNMPGYIWLASNRVNSVYVNSAGTIYAATDNGLSISTDQGVTFLTKTTSNGLGANKINDIFIGSDGTIYAATDRGVSISTDKGASFINTVPNAFDPTINLIYVDSNNNIYIDVLGGSPVTDGLCISTDGGNNFTCKNMMDGIGGSAYDVFVDSSGTIYAAIEGGLSISTDGGTSYTNRTTADGLGHNAILGVYVDTNGYIYAATWSGGLSISTDGGVSFITKTTADGLGHNSTKGVYVDTAGNIYVATDGGISISTDGGTNFTNMTTADGLGNNNINSAYIHSSGTVYAATEGGLSISSGYAFVADSDNGLVIIDISDVTDPKQEESSLPSFINSVATVELLAAPGNLGEMKFYGLAEGKNSTLFVAYVTDSNGTPVVNQEVTLNLLVSDGIVPETVTTDRDGKASLYLHIPDTTLDSTDYSLSATAGNITSETLVITYTAPP